MSYKDNEVHVSHTVSVPWIKTEGKAYRNTTLGVPYTLRLNQETEFYVSYLLKHTVDEQGKAYKRSHILRACLTVGLRDAYGQVKDQLEKPMTDEEVQAMVKELLG